MRSEGKKIRETKSTRITPVKKTLVWFPFHLYNELVSINFVCAYLLQLRKTSHYRDKLLMKWMLIVFLGVEISSTVIFFGVSSAKLKTKSNKRLS